MKAAVCNARSPNHSGRPPLSDFRSKKVMISVSQGIAYCKGEIIIFTGNERIPCPVCGGELKVRGTCERKVIRREGAQTCRLRVMECGNCGKTHRELPSFIVPYKRMDAEILSEVAEISEEEHLEKAESSTWRRVRAWITWFLQYASRVLEGLRIAMSDFPTIPDGEPLNRRLAYAVRLMANSGNRVQHRSALTSPGRPAILGAS